MAELRLKIHVLFGRNMKIVWQRQKQKAKQMLFRLHFHSSDAAQKVLNEPGFILMSHVIGMGICRVVDSLL